MNDFIGKPTAEPLDPSTVQVTIPEKFHGNVVAPAAPKSNSCKVEPRHLPPSRGDPTGTLGHHRDGRRDVRASTVAVAQGNLTVTISETPQVSQPQPFSRGQTRVVPRTRVGVQEDGKKLALVKEGVSLQQLIDGLNAQPGSVRATSSQSSRRSRRPARSKLKSR